MHLAYYNEIDPFAAMWLRELIANGHIAPGDVDERSIEDVRPSDLKGYTQCHFFAGIGVWSYALRQAGWPDDRRIWTGSCPCQPFSAAGKGTAFDDERHLWPAFHHLIKECKPECVVGEQVASKDAEPWLDLVQDDMEGLGYAFGAIAFPSAGIGAPHIRDRTYWLADAELRRRECVTQQQSSGVFDSVDGAGERRVATSPHGAGIGGVADADKDGCESWGGVRPVCGEYDSEYVRSQGGLGNSIGIGRGARRNDHTKHDGQQFDAARNADRPSPTNGQWRDADWLFCRDGKWRPVEPGTFPLAHGATARVGRLRGYGNAINAVAAQAFIEAVMSL